MCQIADPRGMGTTAACQPLKTKQGDKNHYININIFYFIQQYQNNIIVVLNLT